MDKKKDNIDYDNIVENALRSVVKESLKIASKNGLNNEHHFYISFNSNYPGVVIPSELVNTNDDEIKIILQHQFWELFPDKDWSTREYEGCGHWYEKLSEISPFINFKHQDVFSTETQDHVRENIQEFKTFIFCDGGDKALEFNTYAPMLKPGDCIAVHDWGQEIFYSQIQHTIDAHNLVVDEPFASSAQSLGTWIMCFRKAG